MPAPAAVYPIKLIPAPAIVETVALALGTCVEDLRGPRGGQSLVFARCIAVLLISDYTMLSQLETGHALGRHNQGGGHQLLSAARKRQGDDQRFRAALEQCRERVLQWSDHV
jgi:hypothetical protein